MGNAQKALVMAAGIFLAIALITIAVVMFVSAQDATKTAQQSFSGIQNELAQTSFTVYDHTTVSGSQVVNALRKFEQQPNNTFGISVTTGQAPDSPEWYIGEVSDTGVVDSTKGTPVNNDAVDFLRENDPHFINPTGRFTSQLIIDHNNMVRGIVFVQQ